MAKSRTELSQLLRAALGSNNVYYQPPESTKIGYPCIIYSLNNEWALRANDKKYLNKRRYTVIVVDKNPDSLIPDKIGEFENSSFDRTYVSDNLNHFVYTIYF